MTRAALLAVLALAARPAGASDFSLPSVEQWWAARAAWEGRRSSKRRSPIPTRESWIGVDACWTREPQPEADALKLPVRVCLRRVGVAVPLGFDLPFHDGSALLVEGEPASGSFHVSGGARRADGWDIVGSVLEARSKRGKCGSIDKGFLTVHAPIDLKGNVQAGPIRVFGHLMDSRLSCPGHAKSSYFEYRREP